MTGTIFFAHAWWFFFDPQGSQWYEGNVYGNLVAIVPTGIILFLYIRSRHLAVTAAHLELKAAHIEHAAKLDHLLNKLDPDTQGGIADVLDRLDETTPGGLGAIRERLDHLTKEA